MRAYSGLVGLVLLAQQAFAFLPRAQLPTVSSSARLGKASEVCRAPGVCSRAKHDVKMSMVAEAPLKKAEETLATRDDIRNIAIIAHVDHGKTTLVDAMLKQARVFRDNEKVQERVMDSNDQERERGITILAKNVAINYGGVKVNIVDTPGHADFGGEVERVLNMVDGVLLVCDAVEGPKPQTRFVLKKALALGHKVVVVVNKIDRPASRPEYVVDTTFDLFCELNASDEQLDFQIVYTSAINGIAGHEPNELAQDMVPLFDTILKLPKPQVRAGSNLQLMVANVDYDSYKGKLGIGRIRSGTIKKGQSVGLTKPGEPVRQARINELFIFDNLGRKEVDEASAGDIVMFSGITDFTIGETLVDRENPQPLTPISVEEPTVKMTFGVNKSPLAGQEGTLLTTRVIKDRLTKELEKNVALRVKDTESADTYEVAGRGQMHLTVLIENMRREGFELMIGAPQVIEKVIDGVKCEPYEMVEVSVPEEYMGGVVDLLAKRKGEMMHMGTAAEEGCSVVEYLVPTRGMIGLRNAMLTATRGMAVMESSFHSYRPNCASVVDPANIMDNGLYSAFVEGVMGPINPREKGSLLAFETGDATTFGIQGAQDRGQLFISPKTKVYEDMIVGVHQRPGDLKVNVCKMKALTNMRSATKEKTEGLMTPLDLSLDAAVEYIADDELVEVTPESIRMCKVFGWEKIKKRQQQ